MKRVPIIIIFAIGALLIGCSHDIMLSKSNSITLTKDGKNFVFYISVRKPRPQIGLVYYWYYKHSLHTTEGNWEGSVLDAEFLEYDHDYNLTEKGHFKNGLKHGKWQRWNKSGKLVSYQTWKSGKLNGYYFELIPDSGLITKGWYKNSTIHGYQFTFKNDTLTSTKKFRSGKEITLSKKKRIRLPGLNKMRIKRNHNDSL